MDEHTLNLRPPIWLPILVALIVGGSYITGKHIEATTEPPPTITVQGQGKVNAVPDIALLTFGVQTGRVSSAQEAMGILAKKMSGIMEAMKEMGIEEKDISTQNLNLHPAYDYQDGKRIERGFEANQNLQVKVRDQEKLTQTLDIAVSEGANQVGGVQFTIDDPEELKEEAREEAIAQAQEKAEMLAESLGKTLGKLRGFNESGGGPIVMPMARMEAMDAGFGGGAPPIPAGEQEIRVNVSVTYEIK